MPIIPAINFSSLETHFINEFEQSCYLQKKTYDIKINLGFLGSDNRNKMNKKKYDILCLVFIEGLFFLAKIYHFISRKT